MNAHHDTPADTPGADDAPDHGLGPAAGMVAALAAALPGHELAGRDYRRPQRISWRRLAEAEEHYEAAGYMPVAVPWVVGHAAYAATTPPDVVAYATLGGYLVASAEQSFLQLMLRTRAALTLAAIGADRAPHDPVVEHAAFVAALGGTGKAQTTTPCFRDEVHDATHHPYFAKVELVRIDDVSEAALEEMIGDAEAFLSTYLPVTRDVIGDGTTDLVCAATGLELGSYGRRTRYGITWLYGTGLAEPRTEQAVTGRS